MKKRGLRDKRAIAPVITTILLVLIVLVLASIVILWGVSFIPEALAKFEAPIEQACDDISFSADVSGSEISVSNLGSIPIYKFSVREEGQKKSEIKTTGETKLGVGGAATLDITLSSGFTGQLTIIPIILGETEDGKIQQFSCPETSWKIIGVS